MQFDIGNWTLKFNLFGTLSLLFTIWMAATGKVDPWLVVLVWAPWWKSEAMK